MTKKRAKQLISSTAIHPGLRHILMSDDLKLAKVALYLTTFADTVIDQLTPERIAKETNMSVKDAKEKLQLLVDFQLIIHVPYDEEFDLEDYWLVNPDFLGPSALFDMLHHAYLCKQFDLIRDNPGITESELTEQLSMFDEEED